MLCPHCGKEHPDQAAFCPETGKTIAQSLCPHCGQAHPAHAQFCPVTGRSLQSVQVVQAPLSAKRPRRVWTALVGLTIILLFACGVAWMVWGQELTSRAGSMVENLISIRPASSEAVTISVTPTFQSAETTQTDVPSSSPTASPLATRTRTPKPTSTIQPSATSDVPFGKIVFTCQVFKNNNRNQICIMNADGTAQRRLTTNDRANHFYSSLSPDGTSIVFSSNLDGAHEIYEMDLNGKQNRLTYIGELYAPEISPDESSIVFTNAGGTFSSIWIMDRNGDNPRPVYEANGADALDPTWSPDGKKILFAMGPSIETKKLYVINKDGTGLKLVNDEFTTRGRSDWSWSGDLIAGYSGVAPNRKIYWMNADGSNLTELFSKGNVLAPSFSPDDLWVAFTGYLNDVGDGNACEIYILRINKEDLTQLTDNEYCDWQPRWGP